MARKLKVGDWVRFHRPSAPVGFVIQDAVGQVVKENETTPTVDFSAVGGLIRCNTEWLTYVPTPPDLTDIKDVDAWLAS